MSSYSPFRSSSLPLFSSPSRWLKLWTFNSVDRFHPTVIDFQETNSLDQEGLALSFSNSWVTCSAHSDAIHVLHFYLPSTLFVFRSFAYSLKFFRCLNAYFLDGIDPNLMHILSDFLISEIIHSINQSLKPHAKFFEKFNLTPWSQVFYMRTLILLPNLCRNVITLKQSQDLACKFLPLWMQKLERQVQKYCANNLLKAVGRVLSAASYFSLIFTYNVTAWSLHYPVCSLLSRTACTMVVIRSSHRWFTSTYAGLWKKISYKRYESTHHWSINWAV